MTAYRYAVTIAYVGVLEWDDDDGEPDEDELSDTAVDWVLDGGYRDRTIVDVDVKEIEQK